jgi:ribosomal protein L9
LESQNKKKQLLGDLEGVRQLVFNRAVVPNSEHTFGSVTAEDLISKLKEEFGLEVEKSTIDFKSEGGRIKSLGKHQVFVQIGQETAEINVLVNAAV